MSDLQYNSLESADDCMFQPIHTSVRYQMVYHSRGRRGMADHWTVVLLGIEYQQSRMPCCLIYAQEPYASRVNL